MFFKGYKSFQEKDVRGEDVQEFFEIEYGDDRIMSLELIADANIGCWSVRENQESHSMLLLNQPPTEEGERECRQLLEQELVKYASYGHIVRHIVR